MQISNAVGTSGYGIVEFGYDAAGRLQLKTDQTGNTVTFNFDLASRMTQRDYRTAANSPSGTIADSDVFTHDRASRALKATSGRYNNVVTMTFDEGGRLDAESLGIDSQTYTVSRDYDPLSRLSKMIYPDGTEVERTYTNRGQLNTVKYAGSVVDTRVYDAGGRLDTSTYANGVVANYDYRDDINGKDNMISQIASTNPGAEKIGTYAYGYDANKNKTDETITGGGASNSYGFSTGATGYDDDNRLTSWNRTDGNKDQTWNLSLVGDWNSFTDEAATQNRTHSDIHEVDTINSTALTNDVRGNLTSYPAAINPAGSTHTMTWDMDNRMASIDNGSTSQIAKYDALGRRVKYGPSATAKTYIYAGQQLVCRYDNGGAPSSPKLRYAYGSYIDEPILIDRKTSGWNKYYYSRNQQYSISCLTNQSGNVVERYAYSAYGETTIMDGTGTLRTGSNFNNNFMYTGRFYHATLQIYYFRARIYSPSLGRFISQDPLGFVDGMSLYRAYFVPRGVDPWGLLVVDDEVIDQPNAGDPVPKCVTILDPRLKGYYKSPEQPGAKVCFVIGRCSITGFKVTPVGLTRHIFHKKIGFDAFDIGLAVGEHNGFLFDWEITEGPIEKTECADVCGSCECEEGKKSRKKRNVQTVFVYAKHSIITELTITTPGGVIDATKTVAAPLRLIGKIKAVSGCCCDGDKKPNTPQNGGGASKACDPFIRVTEVGE